MSKTTVKKAEKSVSEEILDIAVKSLDDGKEKKKAKIKEIRYRAGKVTKKANKYIPYASNEENKIIVQGKVTTNVKNYVLPVKKTNINISIPQIAGEYPEKVSVINNTEEITKELNKENITYDEKNGSKRRKKRRQCCVFQ